MRGGGQEEKKVGSRRNSHTPAEEDLRGEFRAERKAGVEMREKHPPRRRTGSGTGVLRTRGGDGQTHASSSTPLGTAQITHLETGAGDTEKETRRKEGGKG